MDAKVVQVAAGGAHTCAITALGSTYCWGDNSGGQLGSIGANTRVPRRVSSATGLGVARNISAGGNSTCVTDTANMGYCWGANDFGKLGTGALSGNAAEPINVFNGSVLFASLSAGAVNTCGRRTDGMAVCWGAGNLGQLGQGSTGDSLTPVTPFEANSTSPLNIKQIAASASGNFTCAVLNNGGVRCWGKNDTSQLGDGTAADKLSATPVTGYGSKSSVVLAAGSNSTCAAAIGGGLTCWGSNASNKLAFAGFSLATSAVNVPSYSFYSSVSNGSGALNVALGDAHSCVVGLDNRLRCAGNNGRGQLGDNTYSTVFSIVLTNLALSVAELVAGDQHTCVRRPDGSVYCVGDNQFSQSGQMGGGTVGNFIPITLPAAATQLTVGANHGCALVGGNVLCWGANTVGQLGSVGANTHVPTAVSLPASVVMLAAGGDSTCAGLSGGAVYCWGADIGTTPSLINTFSGSILGLAVSTAPGTTVHHACAITSAGAVQCWGDNTYGQLGNGSTTASATPVAATGLSSGFIKIVAGASHTCATRNDGALFCWGRNHIGQLGDGTNTDRLTPMPLLTGQVISEASPTASPISGSGTLSASVSSGLTPTFSSFTPNTCAVSGNTVTVVASGYCGLRATQAGLTVNAGSGTFAAAPAQIWVLDAKAIFTITTATTGPMGGGNIACTPNPVNQGSTSTCTATPTSGYRTVSISGCGGTATAAGVNTYTTAAITAACTVTADFEVTFNGTCGTAANVGVLTAPAANLCNPGTASMVATNALNFSWTCQGAGGGSTANCAAPRQSVISATAGANGALSCVSPANNGTSTTCTAVPNMGYRTLNMAGCGGTTTAAGVNTYITAAITAACTVTANFELRVDGSCGSANSVASPTPPTLNHCSSGFAISVATNAQDFTWTCFGDGGGANQLCSAARQFAVTALAGANGSISCASPVTSGAAVTCVTTPNAGYRTLNVSGCGGMFSNSNGNRYTTGAISAPCTVTATFDATANAVCGAANGVATTTAPTAALCTVGAASTVATSARTFDWSCAGVGNGAAASCSAPRRFNVVTASISGSVQGTVSQLGAIEVVSGGALDITVRANARYFSSASGTCSVVNTTANANTQMGAGSTVYRIQNVSSDCSVIFSFSANQPAITVSGPATSQVGASASFRASIVNLTGLQTPLTVSFSANGSPIAGCTSQTVTVSGISTTSYQASCDTAALAVGSYNISATLVASATTFGATTAQALQHEVTPPPPPPPPPPPVLVGTSTLFYRLQFPPSSAYLFTADSNEIDALSTRGWVREASLGQTFVGNGSLQGVAAIPLYRLVYAPSPRHLFTTDLNEYTVLAARGWVQEGIAGYVAAQASTDAKHPTLPLTRLYNSTIKRHFYSTNSEEIAQFIARGWQSEAVIGYVLQ